MTESRCQSVVIAGLSGGSGKSVVTVALIAALRKKGHTVVPFKKGPDYIDAGWMTAAAATPCYNLDPFLMSREAVTESFQRYSCGAEFAVVEGNRGLYDGVNAEGGFSTADLAVTLDLPVFLVVNCTKATRTVAAMVLGCRELDKRVHIAGVILNQIATLRHERVITEAIKKYTGIPVIGIVPRLRKNIFPMRHLGVTPHQEYGGADEAVHTLADIAAENFDFKQITHLLPSRPCFQPHPVVKQEKQVQIGILRDEAFQFYYEENLDALRNAGAALVMINALTAECLPPGLDALYIGGGFPETSAGALADNASFRQSVYEQVEQGLPVYAECGGLIFLGKSIILDGREYPLTGVFPVTFGMAKKPQAHGYSICTVEKPNPFYPCGTTIKGHEFRYSTVATWPGSSRELVFSMDRGTGFKDRRDGLVRKNVLALYTHVLAPGTPEWADGLLAAARRYKKEGHAPLL